MAYRLYQYAGPGQWQSPSQITTSRREALKVAGAAHAGEGTDCTIEVDDDAGTLSIPQLKQIALTEDASGVERYIWGGRVIKPLYRRGDVAYGNARKITLSLNDLHWNLRRLRVVNWARGVETDVARAQALAAAFLNGSSSTDAAAPKRPSTVINATTYVPNTNTVSMPAKTYNGVDPWSVLDDIARSSGKEWFLWLGDGINGTNGTVYLWMDLSSSTSLLSTLAINDDGSANRTTIFGPITDEAEAEWDSSEQLSGLGGTYGSGSLATARDAATESAYDVAEETVYLNAATTTEANNQVATMLAQRKVPEPRLTLPIRVPATVVHQIKPGLLISAKSAARGIPAATNYRIARAELAVPPGALSDGLYTGRLELAYPEKIRSRIQDRNRMEVTASQEVAATVGGIASCLPPVLVTVVNWDWSGGVNPNYTDCNGTVVGNPWGEGVGPTHPTSTNFNHDGGSACFLVTAGTTYEIRASIGPFNNDPVLLVSWFGGAGLISTAIVFCATIGAGFTLLSGTVTAPAAATNAKLQLVTGGATCTSGVPFTGYCQQLVVSTSTPAVGECWQENNN